MRIYVLSILSCHSDAPDVAIRIWPGEFGIDEVVSPTAHSFYLINLPFYYVGVLDKVLEKKSWK